jgi:5-methylcytosine-specific restriction endonuclease McrA
MKKDYKKLRNEILMKYGGNCAYCGINLIDKKFHIDHIEPIVRNIGKSGCENPENDNFENLNPSCPSCNIQKNSFTLEQFRSNIKSFLNSLNQYFVLLL